MAYTTQDHYQPRGHGDTHGFRTLYVIQSVICLIFGALLFAMPTITLYAVVVLLGTYWLLRGLLTLVQSAIEPDGWFLRGIFVVLSILAGLMVVQAPLFGIFPLGSAILLFLGFQAIIAGGAEIVLAVRERTGELAVLGGINVVFGAFLLAHPLIDVTTLPITLGSLTLLAGGLALLLSVRYTALESTAMYHP